MSIYQPSPNRKGNPMSRQELSIDLIRAVDRFRVSNHTTFERSTREAIRILQRQIGEKPKHRKLITKSEFLEGMKRRHSIFARFGKVGV